MWWLSALGGLVALATGLLTPADALHVIERIAPVLVFLVAVTVIAGLADAAKVFEVAAREAAHLGRGKVDSGVNQASPCGAWVPAPATR